MTVPVLAGPTASGKTALTLALAERLPLEIVSADAMMVYRHMDIGTAKPTPEERARVSHHLIDVLDPGERFSVADYVRLAEAAIQDVLERGNVPLVVGGTGFYIRALAEGLATVPEADLKAQQPFWERFEREGIEPLHAKLLAQSSHDAERAQRNPRRVIRALEILARTGRPPSVFPKTKPMFRYKRALLLPSMEQLEPRIKARTEAMFAAGLVDEVRGLLADHPNLGTARQAIGYKEVAEHLANCLTLDEAKAAVTLATRQYAKRQRTWFRKEAGRTESLVLEAVSLEVMEKVREWLMRLSADRSEC